jgi:hypothetical protein
MGWAAFWAIFSQTHLVTLLLLPAYSNPMSFAFFFISPEKKSEFFDHETFNAAMTIKRALFDAPFDILKGLKVPLLGDQIGRIFAYGRLFSMASFYRISSKISIVLVNTFWAIFSQEPCPGLLLHEFQHFLVCTYPCTFARNMNKSHLFMNFTTYIYPRLCHFVL